MRMLPSALGWLVGALLAMPGPAPGQTELPQPTGRYGIGQCVLHWTDATRPETQSGKAGEQRELLVYLFYPIDRGTPGERAEYMSSV